MRDHRTCKGWHLPRPEGRACTCSLPFIHHSVCWRTAQRVLALANAMTPVSRFWLQTSGAGNARLALSERRTASKRPATMSKRCQTGVRTSSTREFPGRFARQMVPATPLSPAPHSSQPTFSPKIPLNSPTNPQISPKRPHLFWRKLLSLPPRGAWIEILPTAMVRPCARSRSPHGERGLKYNGKCATCTKIVAPPTGAWIEIQVLPIIKRAAKCRSPTGSVD